MPLYEEKLLSPFAIRFTQEGIRTTFRDGRAVEASRAEITSRPGVGDYDLILDAPFPAIEIIRWAPRHQLRGASSEESTTDEEAEERELAGEQWFTYDNRRLYCLQRAAAELWPRRVAAVVQVMYASDANALRRKFDTASQGRSVTVCRHVHGDEAPLFTWSWRRSVSEVRAAAEEAARAALSAVAADGRKARVEELQDAPPEAGAAAPLLGGACGGSALERLEAQLAREAQLAQEAAEAAEAAKAEGPHGAAAGGGAARLRGQRRRGPRRGTGGRGEAASEEAVAPPPARTGRKPTRATPRQPRKG